MSAHAKTHRTSPSAKTKRKLSPEVELFKKLVEEAFAKTPGTRLIDKPGQKPVIMIELSAGDKLIENLQGDPRFMDLLRKWTKPKTASESLTPDEAFADLHAEYGKAGTMLRGARTREGLTQEELAAAIGVKQHHISQMESGDRPIGKVMAKRLAGVLKVDYRRFL